MGKVTRRPYSIAGRLNALKEKDGMTLRAFSDKAGIGQSTMHNYLKGRDPKLELAAMICRAFNVNSDWLLFGRGPVYRDSDETLEVSDRELFDLTKKIATLSKELSRYRVASEGQIKTIALQHDVLTKLGYYNKAEQA